MAKLTGKSGNMAKLRGKSGNKAKLQGKSFGKIGKAGIGTCNSATI